MLNAQNIEFGILILTNAFAVFLYFRNPQVKEEKKSAILSEQIKGDKEETNRRFGEMSTRLDDAMTLAQNHVHTVDTKVDKLIERMGGVEGGLIKVFTIIDERIPKK